MTARTIILGAASLSCCLTMTVAVAEDEPQYEIRPVEILACNYQPGKGMSDLARVTARWNEWMDKNKRKEYWAYTLVPMYHSEEIDFDIAWVGGWKDGATMAESTQFWIENGGALQAEFEKVADCSSHTNFAVLDIKSAPDPFQTGPLEFSNCKVKEGRKFEDALAAVYEWVSYQSGHGIEAGHYMLFPAFGESSEADYSFKWVALFSYEMFGRSYDQFGTGGGWRKSEELFDGLLDCDSSRIYHGTPVRKVEME